jgi:chromosome segregation ATPase
MVSQLGTRALEHARNKLRALEQEQRFRPEERQFLVEQWRRLREETERATEELGNARREFTELLRTLQANEDFIDELVQIRQAQKALEVIRRLSKDIREASDQLKRLIGGIKPPGA